LGGGGQLGGGKPFHVSGSKLKLSNLGTVASPLRHGKGKFKHLSKSEGRNGHLMIRAGGFDSGGYEKEREE